MGKSTTAAMFRAGGVPVHEADAAVHRLYSGRAVPLIEAAFPGVAGHGAVDRARLAERVVADPDALARLESLVHPLVRDEEEAFLAQCRREARRIALIDVPLLFESGREGRADLIAVVTAASEIQRTRVLSRPGMTEAKLQSLLSRQLPDREKRSRAHFVIDSGHGFEPARRQVTAILRALASSL